MSMAQHFFPFCRSTAEYFKQFCTFGVLYTFSDQLVSALHLSISLGMKLVPLNTIHLNSKVQCQKYWQETEHKGSQSEVQMKQTLPPIAKD